MSNEITNLDDVIDSRDVIMRLAELEEAEERSEEEAEELAALKALAEEAEGYSPDWTYGATLIRDSYFTQYAEELADDIGAIDSKAGWPCYCIDWEWAARDLKLDYMEVDFAGVSYWVR